MVELNTEVITPLPLDIIDKHSEIIIGMDIMCVNGIPFLTTINRIVRFGSSTEIIGAATADNAFSALKHIPEFIELEIMLSLTAEDEHEPYIERFNRTIEEKGRMGITGVPFTKLPK